MVVKVMIMIRIWNLKVMLKCWMIEILTSMIKFLRIVRVRIIESLVFFSFPLHFCLTCLFLSFQLFLSLLLLHFPLHLFLFSFLFLLFLVLLIIIIDCIVLVSSVSQVFVFCHLRSGRFMVDWSVFNHWSRIVTSVIPVKTMHWCTVVVNMRVKVVCGISCWQCSMMCELLCPIPDISWVFHFHWSSPFVVRRNNNSWRVIVDIATQRT